MMVKRVLMGLIFLVLLGSILFSEFQKRFGQAPAALNATVGATAPASPAAPQSISGDPSLPPEQNPAPQGQ